MLPSSTRIAAGALALFFANQSVQVLAIPFYQMTLSVNPLWLAFAMALPLLLGSLTAGPLARWCSQQRSTKALHQLIALSSLLLGGSFALMWLVPPAWTSGSQLAYFSLCCLLYFGALPLLSVPFTALLLEQAAPAQTRAFAIVSAVHKLGSLGYQWLVPLCQLSYFSSFFSGIRQVGVAVALLLISWPAWWFTRQAVQPRHHTLSDTQPTASAASLRAIALQPAMWRLLCCGALQLCGCAAVAGYDFYLLVYSQFNGDLAAGSTQKAWLSSMYAIAGLAWVPVLNACQQRVGALATLSAAYAINALGGIAKWWWFAPMAGNWVLLDALCCSVAWSAVVMLLPPLLHQAAKPMAADGSHSAQIGALHHWLVGASAALALILSGLGLNLLAFDRTASSLASTLDVLRGLLSGGTTLCAVLGLLLLWQVKRLTNCCKL